VALELVAVTVAQPSRIHTGFPAFACIQGEHLFAIFKEHYSHTPDFIFCQENFCYIPPAHVKLSGGFTSTAGLLVLWRGSGNK